MDCSRDWGMCNDVDNECCAKLYPDDTCPITEETEDLPPEQAASLQMQRSYFSDSTVGDGVVIVQVAIEGDQSLETLETIADKYIKTTN